MGRQILRSLRCEEWWMQLIPTMGTEDDFIDLMLYSTIFVDTTTPTVIKIGGDLRKEAALPLAKYSIFTVKEHNVSVQKK